MRKLLLLLLTVYSISIAAQSGKISGQLINQKDAASVPYCSVVLYTASDSLISGTFTNENGKFKFTEILFGRYYITSESLTHEPYKSEVFEISADNKSIQLGEVKLKQASILTDVVEISVDRPAVKVEPAKKPFDVQSTGADIGGTAADVLNNLPSVEVGENGEISLRGNSNIRVLIDGKPAGVNADDINLVISQLPANSIETIELITVPSAKYDPEGVGGIINIVLKKQRAKGYRGTINVAYSTFDKVNASTALNINKKKWNIGINYSYTDGTYWRKRTNDAFTSVADSTTIFENHQTANTRRPNHIGKLNVGYAINKNTKVSWDGTINHMTDIERDSSYLFWNYNNESTDLTNRISDEFGTRLNTVSQFGLNTKLKKGITVDFLARQRGFRKPEKGVFSETTSKEKEERLFTSLNFENQIDVKIPIRVAENDTVNGKYFIIETGVKSANRTFNEAYDFFEFSPSLSAYQTNDDYNQTLDYNESIYAGYGLINFGSKKNQVSVGLRAEHTALNSETKTKNVKTSFFNLFPTFSVVRNINEFKSLSLSYSKRIKRPRGSQLNPIPSLANPFNLRIGNAELLPEMSHMTEFSYLTIGKKLTFNSTLFYQYRDNRLGRLSYTDSSGVSVVMWYNFKFHQTLGLENFANYKFNKWLKANASLTLYQTWVDASDFRDAYVTDYFGYDAKVNLQFSLSKKTSANITGTYNSERQAVVGPLIPRYASDMAIKHKVLKDKGAISIRYSDVFRTRRFGIDVLTDGWVREVRYRGEWSLIWVGFNYNFGQSTFKKNTGFSKPSRESDD